MKATAKNAGFAKVLLLNHGEKIGMLLVGAAAAWLLYASLSPEGESRAPSELNQLVSTANTGIQSFSASQAPSPAEDPENAIFTEEMWQPIPSMKVAAKDYQTDKYGWGQPPVPPIVLRSDPVLLAAEKLEGFGGTAPMATMDAETLEQRELERLRKEKELAKQRETERELASQAEDRGGRGGRGGFEGGRGGFGETLVDENRRQAPSIRRNVGVAVSGDERIDLVSYACVTAVAPIKDQYELYKDAFANALGYQPARDQPQYLGYLVERTEVTPGGKVNWQSVKVKDISTKKTYPLVYRDSILESTSSWVPGMPPLVDSRYFHPSLTFPLPPLVGKNFGREVVHSDVPLQSETDAKNALEEQNPEAEGVAPEGASLTDLLGNSGAAAPGGRGGYGGEMGGGRGGYGGGEFGGYGGGEFGGYGGGEFGGGRGGYGGEMGGGRGGARAYGGGSGEYIMSVPQVMLRFFDFTVQPGKRYRYRVQLLLSDPNAKTQVDVNYLDREAKQRVEDPKNDAKFRKAEWSEPSRIISIPAAGEVYIASVKPAPTRTANGEPTAELLVKSYDIDETNRARQAEKIMSFNRGGVLNRTVEDLEILRPPYLEKIDSFTFKTNVTLLDIDGGEKISRDTSAPGRVLLMDASGRLFVQDEFSSKSEVDMHNMIFAEPEDTPARGGRGEFGGEYGGFEGIGL